MLILTYNDILKKVNKIENYGLFPPRFSVRERTISLAEIKNIDAVAALDAMDAHVDDWRDATKGKQRGIFSFDDVAALKIKNLKKRIYTLEKNIKNS